MVTFKIGTIETANFETPQEMFDDYKNRKITNIYDYQSKMLDLYLETESGKSDIALELPTGTGKTLVGLLIGEFRRRKHKEKILYLCPNNQLVYQTVKHAVEDYGISATPFVGKNINYSQKDKLAYNMAESIAVTSYSSLFNSNPYFSDADIIIFDDAHSGESYVASNWTVSAERKKDSGLYFSLLESFKDCIEVEAYERMISPNQTTDSEWFDLVPNIKLLQRNRVLKKIISDYIEEEPETNVKYPWSMIQESLDSCNVFISCDQIVIRPFIPPTLSFPPFARAKQRIYMSATLGKSGELERSFGVPKIEKLPMVKDWDSFDEEPYKQLSKAAPHEVNAQYCIWKRDYRGALECIEMVCACLCHDSLKGYLGFWLYIAGFCAYNQYKLGDSTYQARYIDYLQRAASTTLSINWFNKLIELPDTSSIDSCYLEYVVENIETKILSVRAKHLHMGDIFQELDDLINCMTEAKGLDFEKAYETLGQWLGYRTTNPRGDAEPDPIWILNPNLCIVSENKIYDNQSKSIPVRHVRETAGHPNWIKDHYETLCLSKDVECITVFVTNATTIDSAAVIHALGIYYLNQKELCAWAGKYISVLKELILSFDAIGDVIWRDKAVKLMKQSAVTPKDYIDLIKSKELSKLRSV